MYQKTFSSKRFNLSFNRSIIGVLVLFFVSFAMAQAVNITGSVVDSASSLGILNAKIKLVSNPKCTTKTTANGAFSLVGSTSILSQNFNMPTLKAGDISLQENALVLKNLKSSSKIIVDVYSVNGSRVYHSQNFVASAGNLRVSNLWKASGIYIVNVNINGNKYVVECLGMSNKVGASNFITSTNNNSLAKTTAAETLEVSATGYVTKRFGTPGLTGVIGVLKLRAEPKPNTGTGTTYAPSYIKTVGAGPMPDISGGIVCNCDGTGATDAGTCIQSAANAARTAKKPLLLPYTTGFYKIARALTIYGSFIGTGGMPTIKQTGAAVGIKMPAGATGWIYNLHIVGTYNGTVTPSEYEHNISLGGVNGVTISGCILETPMGDNVSDNAQESDGATPCKNVLIDGNTMLNPRRVNVALINIADSWAIMNNYMTYASGYVDPIDLEPWKEGSLTTNIELGYNKIDSPAKRWSTYGQNSWYGVIADCDDAFDKTPGGNIYMHHNYGTWGVPFFGTTSSWYNVNNIKNVAGNSVPQ